MEKVRRSTRLSLKINKRSPQLVEDENHRNGRSTRVSKVIKVHSNEDQDFYYVKPKNRVRRSTTPQSDSSPEKSKPDSLTSPKRKPSTAHDTDAHCVTPPKQKKVSNDENSPLQTPSRLLKKLSLNSPEKIAATQIISKENNMYLDARKALHSTCPTYMPGRQNELETLRNFIWEHLDGGSSGTIYVSGPPGTGKTASLNLILQEDKFLRKLTHVYVNCTSIKTSGSIFSRIYKDLGLTCGCKTEKGFSSAIENYLSKKNHAPVILVLDEIDQLESKNQSVLYKIFEWPSLKNSHLILVGIANALDLTDRILPRLQTRCELKPQLLSFAPYTKQQIVQILTKRLENAAVLDVFSPVALQMLAAKVAAVSGDLRRALDIARRVVELVEQKQSFENTLKCVENLGESETTKKKVELKEVVSVLNNVYGTTQSLDEGEDSFPLQQKIVICCLVLILKKAKNKDITVGRLHEVYRRVCMKRNIQNVDQSEFVGLCALIETRGILRIIKKKDPRLGKVGLVWDEAEVARSLRDKQLMAAILEDVDSLGKL